MSDVVIAFFGGGAFVIALLFLRRRFADFMGQTAKDYADDHPTFDMREHLNGRMICDGVIFGPLGRVTSTFDAVFEIGWVGDTCTMKEDFQYNDGSTQTREWRITLGKDGTFVALADDVPGKAQGKIAGNTVLINYPIRLPDASGGHTLTAFDCMYLTNKDIIVNRSQFRKFGFRVAELIATVRKEELQ